MYIRSNKTKEPWQIAAARFCVHKVEFSLQELEQFLENPPYNVDHQVVRNFFTESIQAPPGRSVTRDFRTVSGIQFWTAPTELVSMITDFEELQDARKNARSAFKISMAALAVSALGAFFQYLSIPKL